jgi:hypothetical protein
MQPAGLDDCVRRRAEVLKKEPMQMTRTDAQPLGEFIDSETVDRLLLD